MSDLRFKLAEIINGFSPEDGIHEVPVLNTYCIKFSQPDTHSKRHWRTSLGIVAQGGKEVALGRDLYSFDAAHYIAATIDLPVSSRVFSASPENPFLCLRMDFDSIVLHEVAAQMEVDFPKETNNSLRAMFVGKASDKMLDAAIRLGQLFDSPEDAPVLGSLVVKEIVYYLLKGDDGPAIRQFVRSGSKMHKISQAVYRIRTELTDDLDVETLAKSANMSRSAFFKHFNEATAMSPIQYQKRFRLLEAKRLMIEEDETAESAAFKVGYKSASQFSREYSRMFGNAPFRDVVNVKNTSHPIHLYHT
jgi:AraC-like DNA-binding protein